MCTFGYTTPYWDWNAGKRNELHGSAGVNMPLATVASEAIAERVWLKMGLKEEDIRLFLPARHICHGIVWESANGRTARLRTVGRRSR